MAVAFLNAVEFERTLTTDPQTWTHVPGGVASAVAVAVVHGTSATDHALSVTYGGVALARMVRATDTATELGAAEWWFLGSGIPAGNQTVSVDLASATTDDIHFVSMSFSAADDCEIQATGSINENATNPSVTLSYGGRTCLAVAALYGGGAAPSSFVPNANCSAVLDFDFGAFYSTVIQQTTAGSTDFAIGGTAVSDDVAYVAMAITERRVLTPGVGVAALSGLAAALAFAVQLAAGSVAISQETVGVAFQSPPPGTVTITGRAPTASITAGSSVPFPAGAVTFTGTTFTLAMPVAIQNGSVATTGLAPTLGSGVSLPVGSVAFSGAAPFVARDQLIVLPVGSIVVAGQAPTVGNTASITRAMPVGAIALSGAAPGIGFGTAVPVGAATYAGLNPSIAGLATLIYVGGAKASGTSGSFALSLVALTGGAGSSAAAGDLVVVAAGFVSTANGDPGVSTAGYTEIADLYADDVLDANLSVSYKFMGVTPDTSVTCNGSGVATDGSAAVCHVWRNVDTGTPMDVLATADANINSSIPDSPDITPVTFGAQILVAGLGTSTAVDNTVTAPVGYSNQVDISTDPGNAVTVGIASKAWAGGTEAPAAWTAWTTTVNDSWAAVTLALRPAALFSAYVVQVPVGSLVIVPGDPAVAFIGPTVGTVALTGYTVTIGTQFLPQAIIIPVPAGTIFTSGYSAGVVGAGRVFDIPAGTFNTTGAFVGVKFLDPAAGAVTWVGQLPVLQTTTAMPAGAVAVTGQAPLAVRIIAATPAAGVFTITGLAPILAWVSSQPATTVAYNGLSPRWAATMPVAAGVLSNVGTTATLTYVSTTVTMTPAAGVATLTGGAPILAFGVAVPAGSTTFVGKVLGSAGVVDIQVGSVVLTGQAAVVGYPRVPDVGAVVVTGAAPTLSTGVALPAGATTFSGLVVGTSAVQPVPVGSMVLSGAAPQVTFALVYQVPAAALVTVGHGPILVGSGVTGLEAGAVDFVGQAPVLARTIFHQAGAITTVGLAPAVGLGFGLPCGVVTTDSDGVLLLLGTRMAVGTLTLVGATPAPVSTLPLQIGVNVVLAGRAITLSLGVAVPVGTLGILVDAPNPQPGFGRINIPCGAHTLVGEVPVAFVSTLNPAPDYRFRFFVEAAGQPSVRVVSVTQPTFMNEHSEV